MAEANGVGREAANRVRAFGAMLARYEDGWAGEHGGRAPPRPWLDRAVEAVAREVEAGMAPPTLAPTLSGGLELAWDVPGWSVTARSAPGSSEWHLLALPLDDAGELAGDPEEHALDAEGLRLSVAALSGGPALLGPAFRAAA